MLHLLIASVALAGFGDELTDEQGAILSALGAGPGFSTMVAGHMGLGPTWTKTDLFESMDPSLVAPAPRVLTFGFGGYGLGPGTFAANVSVNAGGQEATRNGLTTAAPSTFWASYWSGGNLLSLFGADDPAFGIGPSAWSHAGFQGHNQITLDKVGGVRVLELAHWHLGYGAFTYMKAGGVIGMASIGWMPGFNDMLTLGKIEGTGRFDLGQPEIFVPIESYGEIMAGLIEAENHFRLRSDIVTEARLTLGLLSLCWQYRVVTYAPKAGTHLAPSQRFQLGTHLLSVGFGAIASDG